MDKNIPSLQLFFHSTCPFGHLFLLRIYQQQGEGSSFAFCGTAGSGWVIFSIFTFERSDTEKGKAASFRMDMGGETEGSQKGKMPLCDQHK
jgi:hypothetical protein